MKKPPVEYVKYVCPKLVGFCDKCKQPIYEMATCTEERFSLQNGIGWLREYVTEKLRASGVIPEDAIYALAERIVHYALRCGTSKTPDHYVPDGEGGFKLVKGNFACIESADFEIEWAIKDPPPPISKSRFSLKAFTTLAK